MIRKIFSRNFLWSNTALLLYLILLKFVIHMLVSPNYGYFIDELYTIAESRHPDFGYIDMPPIVPIILALQAYITGYSLVAIRFLPAVYGALMVLLGILMVKKLGGKFYAQVLTAITAIFVPVWLSMNSMYTYDSLDQLVTIFFFYVLMRIIAEEKPKLWLLFGLAAGIGLMTKLSMVFFGLSLVISLLFTKERKYYASRWLWLGGLIALVIVSPFIIWEFTHGWPLIGYWKYYSQYATYHASPLEFISMQIVAMNPLSFPLWLAGLYYFLFDKAGKRFALLGFMYIVPLILFMVLRAKFYMLAAAYMVLFAGGSVLVEKISENLRFTWIRTALPIMIIAGGFFALPSSLPVLPPDLLVRYFSATSFVTRSVKTENFKDVELPQYFADRFGWENQVQKLSEVYQSLSSEEQAKCVILAANYGEAGAVDLLGEKYGLPKAICTHLSYYLWGPGNFNGDVALSIGFPLENLAAVFEEVKPAAIVVSSYAMPRENHVTIFICRKLKYPVQELWPKLRSF